MNVRNQKNFSNGLRNACNILDCLEKSLAKSRDYEKRLIYCKSSHRHSHDNDTWWDSDPETKIMKHDIVKSSRNNLKLSESWSTMSIICLQYQYEELSKRYQSLLKDFDDVNMALVSSESSLQKAKDHINESQSHTMRMHCALIRVGDKYFELRRKRKMQQHYYSKKIEQLKNLVSCLMHVAVQARFDLDEVLTHSMAQEQQATNALLLDEIRKSNRLYWENLKLKAQLEELSPGDVNWDST